LQLFVFLLVSAIFPYIIIQGAVFAFRVVTGFANAGFEISDSLSKRCVLGFEFFVADLKYFGIFGVYPAS
jgi:hypothetical protein